MARLLGYAAVFNSASEDLGGFRESIHPRAFDRAIRERHDVHALFNHDVNLVLGRSTSGTLELSVDATGLRSNISLPDTRLGQDVASMVQRGDVDKMSFAFWPLADDWTIRDGEPFRELLDLELFDVSVVTRPAYLATTVALKRQSVALSGSEWDELSSPLLYHPGGHLEAPAHRRAGGYVMQQRSLGTPADPSLERATVGRRAATLARGRAALARKGHELLERRAQAIARGERPSSLTRDEAALVNFAREVGLR